MVGHSACEEVPLLFPSFFIPFFIFSSSACSPFLKGLALPFPFPFPFPRFLENLLVPCFNFIILLFKFLAPGRGTQSLSPRNSTWGYMLLQVVSKLVIGLFFWLFLLFECVGGFDSFLDIAVVASILPHQEKASQLAFLFLGSCLELCQFFLIALFPKMSLVLWPCPGLLTCWQTFLQN